MTMSNISIHDKAALDLYCDHSCPYLSLLTPW